MLKRKIAKGLKRTPLKRSSGKGKLIHECDALLSKILRAKHKVCQICSNPQCGQLGVFHILDKGQYPKLRYCRENLLIVGWLPCHYIWHHGGRSDERTIKIEDKIKKLRGDDYINRLKVLNTIAPKITPLGLSILKTALLKEISEGNTPPEPHQINEDCARANINGQGDVGVDKKTDTGLKTHLNDKKGGK